MSGQVSKSAIFRDERLISLVKKVVCEYYGENEEKLYSPNRLREIVKLRQIVCYVTKIISPKTSLRLIGETFKKVDGDGNIVRRALDHATVLYCCNTIQDEMDTVPRTKTEVDQIISILKNANPESSEFWKDIEKEYFYVNLHNIKVLKITENHSIVFSGIDQGIIEKIKEQFFPSPELNLKELKETGLYILDKKFENNGNIRKSV